MGEGLNLCGMSRQKGSLEGYIYPHLSSMIMRLCLEFIHDWWANCNYHEMIINLALDAK